MAGTELDLFRIAMGLFGGLALFLFGMEQMANSLKAVAGERMKTILEKLTVNRFMGAATGALVTAVIQSSSVTTVLVVGFVSAGLMTLAQSVGVIMGANIGTTITAQIVAFKVTEYALLMIAVGFALLFAGKRDTWRQYGGMLMGLGLVFFGMGVMSDAMAPLRGYPPFLDLMRRMQEPALGILIGAGFTALIQSSSATTGIVIVMATQGFITLPAGIALAFGANVGTCATALLASIGKPRAAVRAAVVHILFNVAGVIVWFAFIDHLAILVTWLSPAAAGLAGHDRLAAEAPRQIANAHTVFNLSNTLLFIWFTGPIARLVEWLVPDRPPPEKAEVRPRFLDETLLDAPTLALNVVRLELNEMAGHVRTMLADIMPATLRGTVEKLDEIRQMDERVDALYGHLVAYLRELGRRQASQREARDLVDLMEIANHVESIGDIIETDLYVAGTRRAAQRLAISDKTAALLEWLHAEVTEAFDLAIRAAVKSDLDAAQQVLHMSLAIDDIEREITRFVRERLYSADPSRVAHYSRELDIVEKLKRIYYFAKRIARAAGGDTDPGEAPEERNQEIPVAPVAR